MSVGFAVFLVRRLFSALCRAPLPALQVTLRGFCLFLATSACPTAALVASVGLPPFPCGLSASPTPAGLPMLDGFCTL